MKYVRKINNCLICICYHWAYEKEPYKKTESWRHSRPFYVRRRGGSADTGRQTEKGGTTGNGSGTEEYHTIPRRADAAQISKDPDK